MPDKFIGRLSGKKEITTILQKGRRITSPLFQARFFRYFHSNPPTIRLGVIVSNKISKKAVVRNRVKRRTREAVKRVGPEFGISGGLFLFPSESVSRVPFEEIEKNIRILVKKIHLWVNDRDKKTP